MHETSKAIFRRLNDSRFATRYFVGDGIDIGSGPDPLAQYHEFFPRMKSCRSWDLKDGDAQQMAGVADRSFDFVHSSHCLEHLRDPRAALASWLRILKRGGHLVCLVPDEDLYEQGRFPSTFNPDHKHTFTPYKRKSWSPASINLFDLLASVEPRLRVLKIELLDATFRYRLAANSEKRIDQTMTPVGECAIEFVVQRVG
jgi:SAM-dependent methyltransferase